MKNKQNYTQHCSATWQHGSVHQHPVLIGEEFGLLIKLTKFKLINKIVSILPLSDLGQNTYALVLVAL